LFLIISSPTNNKSKSVTKRDIVRLPLKLSAGRKEGRRKEGRRNEGRRKEEEGPSHGTGLKTASYALYRFSDLAQSSTEMP
jgi:hypothetical protein